MRRSELARLFHALQASHCRVDCLTVDCVHHDTGLTSNFGYACGNKRVIIDGGRCTNYVKRDVT